MTPGDAALAVIALVSATSLGIALRLWLRGIPDQTLRRAFEALEDDFEKLQRRVDSHLGRVARLKAEMQQRPMPPAPANAVGSPLQHSAELTAPASEAPMSRAEAYAQLKARGLIH